MELLRRTLRRAPARRAIATPQVVLPQEVHHGHRLSSGDKELMDKVRAELQAFGVVEDSSSTNYSLEESERPEDFLQTAAASGTSNVSQLASQSPSALDHLQERELLEGDTFDNPSLDGIDDYGLLVYGDTAEAFPKQSTAVDFIPQPQEEAPYDVHVVEFRLPDGTYLTGRRVSR